MLGPEKRNDPLVREGFYMDLTGDNVLEFRSLSAKESAERTRELPGRAGWIDLDVFASKTDRVAPAGG